MEWTLISKVYIITSLFDSKISRIGFAFIIGLILVAKNKIIIGLLLGLASYGIIGVFITILARRAIGKGKKKEEKEVKTEE